MLGNSYCCFQKATNVSALAMLWRSRTVKSLGALVFGDFDMCSTIKACLFVKQAAGYQSRMNPLQHLH